MVVQNQECFHANTSKWFCIIILLLYVEKNCDQPSINVIWFHWANTTFVSSLDTKVYFFLRENISHLQTFWWTRAGTRGSNQTGIVIFLAPHCNLSLFNCTALSCKCKDCRARVHVPYRNQNTITNTGDHYGFWKVLKTLSVSLQKAENWPSSINLWYHSLEKTDLQIEGVGPYTVFLIFSTLLSLIIGLQFRNKTMWPDSQKKWFGIWTLIGWDKNANTPTLPMSSPIMPFQDPLESAEPYFPSPTWYMSYLKPRILARASRTSIEKPLYLLGWPRIFSATITKGSSCLNEHCTTGERSFKTGHRWQW